MASSPEARGEEVRRPGRGIGACRPGRGNRRNGPGPNLLLAALLAGVRRPGRGNRRNGPGPNLLLAALLAGACASTDRLPPLAAAGDPERGREVFVSRDAGHCVLCHAAPGIAPAGNVGPSLAGVGARLDAGQLRLRIADITRVNPKALMPPFHRTEGLTRVASAYAGKPVLTARQVEDVVAWLETLR